MRYGSVCSGIEAATAAWHPLGWEPAFFSEIEAFPSAVLKYHYPDVPLHGDFTTIGQHQYGQIDLLVGGTPCQSFSVAGLRGGLDDDRGNLALEFCRLAQRKQPRWIVWENVPGVLSSGGGRDFGSILGALEDLGYGLAYRVLDAQFFGVPQRRRRVFVVGYLGDWRPAAAVLFERHGLSGHPAPRREAREDTTHGLAPCLTSSGRGVERTGDTRGQDPVVAIGRERPAVGGAVPHVSPTLRAGGNKTGGDRPPGTDVDTADSLIPVLAPSVVGTLRTRRPGEGGVQGDFDHIVPVLSPALNTQSGSHHAPDTKAYVVTHPSLCADVAGPLTAKGPTALGAPEVDGNHYIASTVPIAFGGQMPQPMTATNMSLTLQAKNPQAVAYAIQERAVSLNLEAGPQGSGFRDDNTAYTLEARNKVQAVVFDTTQITSPQNYSNPQPGDPCHPLAAGAHPPTVAYDPIAFSAKDYGGDAGSISPTLRSGSHAGSHANGGVMPAVTYPINTQMALRKIDVATFGDTARTLSARHDGSPCADRGPDVVAVANGGVMPAVAYGFQPRIARNGRGDMGDVVSALSAQSGETGKGDAAPCVAIGVDVYNGIVTGETAATLGANSGNSNTSGPKVMARSGETDKGDAAPCEAFQQTADCLTSAYSTKWNGNASATNGSLFAGNNWAVRRLTPVECERLQGFPDGFTDIPWRKKPVGDCPDGPRYKALGNSMAVPVMRWIGERIQLVDDLLSLI